MPTYGTATWERPGHLKQDCTPENVAVYLMRRLGANKAEVAFAFGVTDVVAYRMLFRAREASLVYCERRGCASQWFAKVVAVEKILDERVEPIDPLHVWCHLCHADCGQPCRWGTEPGEYHDRRVNLAKTVARKRAQNPDTWAEKHRDIEHAIAGGALCVEGGDRVCSICGTRRFLDNGSQRPA